MWGSFQFATFNNTENGVFELGPEVPWQVERLGRKLQVGNSTCKAREDKKCKPQRAVWPSEACLHGFWPIFRRLTLELVKRHGKWSEISTVIPKGMPNRTYLWSGHGAREQERSKVSWLFRQPAHLGEDWASLVTVRSLLPLALADQSPKFAEQRALFCVVSNVSQTGASCSLISGYLSGAPRHCWGRHLNSNWKTKIHNSETARVPKR